MLDYWYKWLSYRIWCNLLYSCSVLTTYRHVNSDIFVFKYLCHSTHMHVCIYICICMCVNTYGLWLLTSAPLVTLFNIECHRHGSHKHLGFLLHFLSLRWLFSTTNRCWFHGVCFQEIKLHFTNVSVCRIFNWTWHMCLFLFKLFLAFEYIHIHPSSNQRSKI